MEIRAMKTSLSLSLALLTACACLAAPKAPPAKQWQKLEGVRYKPQRYDDGDSFHVTTADGKELIFRLYFVDTPEEEKKYADRIADQAAYFGVTQEQSLALGHKASEFTRAALSRPFTIWTRWQDALGRSQHQRFYALVKMPNGLDLGTELVRAGLARVFGAKTALPNGWTAQQYSARILTVEGEAKTAGRGGWAATH
jgi:endonuclease YncB( thermonuclease family)